MSIRVLYLGSITNQAKYPCNFISKCRKIAFIPNDFHTRNRKQEKIKDDKFWVKIWNRRLNYRNIYTTKYYTILLFDEKSNAEKYDGLCAFKNSFTLNLSHSYTYKYLWIHENQKNTLRFTFKVFHRHTHMRTNTKKKINKYHE